MNHKLQRLLGLPIREEDIRAYFDFCSTADDIREVIRRLHSEFGEFEILMIDEREGYFMIQRFYNQEGELKSETVSYDFYSVKDDLYYDFRRR